MAELKTKENSKSVDLFLDSVKDEKKRDDCYKIMDWMKKATGKEPKMWGKNIVGFGNYHYKYKSGREGDWFMTGFSPTKTNISLHLIAGFERYHDLMDNLGKCKTGRGCLYIKTLDDIDTKTLKTLIKRSFAEMKKTNLENS